MTATDTPPSASQSAVLAAVVAHWRDHQTGPTVRDLMDATGHRSPNGVVQLLRVLERKGLVAWARGQARGVWPAGLRERIAAAVADLGASNAG